MENIKLVIWDLDNTFWNGILSEEEIVPIERNINIIKQCIDYGIMCSICSKNDFEQAKKKLTELEVFDLFIFPKISYFSKGMQIKELISQVNLRAENVLFIDDSIENLQEAKSINTKLNVSLPDILDTLLDQNFINKSKKDLLHERLNHYKTLEFKYNEKNNYSNNMDFLKQSNIKVDIFHDCIKEKDRIFELIHRTNQLNFTKFRQENSDFEKLLNNENIDCGYVKVFDKYGDYGLIGFYALDKVSNRLIHFLFSCRTIGMGIEQYVYSKLNYPGLTVVGEVINNVGKFPAPDYINSNISSEKKNNLSINKSIVLRGGCDLMQLLPYIRNSDKYIKCEFNHLDFHRDHTHIIRQIKELPESEKHNLVENLNFYDNDCFETEIFNNNNKVVVISVLMDFVQNVYHLKRNKNIKICFGDFDFPVISDERMSKWSNEEKEFWNGVESEGQISSEEFYSNLTFIRNNLSKDTILILINGAEVPSTNSTELNNKRHLVHKKYNLIIDEFIKNNSFNTKLLDVRKIVTSTSMLNDNIRHYKRECYYEMAKELVSIISQSKNEANVGCHNFYAMRFLNFIKKNLQCFEK